MRSCPYSCHQLCGFISPVRKSSTHYCFNFFILHLLTNRYTTPLLWFMPMPISFSITQLLENVGHRIRHLCGDQRLALTKRLGLELLLWCGREILALESWGILLEGWGSLLLNSWWGGSATGAADHLLSLGGVIGSIDLGGLGSASSVVASEFLDLLGLLVNNGRCVGDLVIDELLVGLVDKRSEEEDGGGEES